VEPLSGAVVEVEQAHPSAVLEEVVAGVGPVDVDAPREPDTEINEDIRVTRRTRVHFGTVPLVRNRRVGPLHERGNLAVAHPPVAVSIGGSVQRRAHLVAEDPRLKRVPLVALAVGRRREEQADPRIVGEAERVGKAMHRAPLAAGTAAVRQ